MCLRTLVRDARGALTPARYREHSERPLLSSLAVFFRLLLAGGVLMVLGFLVRLPAIHADLARDLGSFPAFSLDANVSQERPVLLWDRPRIAVDFSKNITDEFILVTNESIQYRVLPLGPPWSVRWKDFTDVRANADTLLPLFVAALVVLLPSLLLVAVAWFAFKTLIMLASLGVLVWLVLRATRGRPAYRALWGGGLHALALLAALELLLLPWTRFTWEPWVLAFLALLLLGFGLGRKAPPPKKRGKKTPPPFIEPQDDFIQPREAEP